MQSTAVGGYMQSRGEFPQGLDQVLRLPVHVATLIGCVYGGLFLYPGTFGLAF